ncbi:hypothetical protein CBA19CS91_01770 [Paraburkholderia hospita]|nr:hypothetical protein CBA19CS91_01770 [Paraburkholderia hospita]
MAGRPTKYKPQYAELAMNYCLLGAKDAEIADFLGIGVRTLNDWKKQYPKFADAMNHGKDQADAKVIGSLYRNALGGNVVAQIFWLKNRRAWKDRVDHAHGGIDGNPIRMLMEAVEGTSLKPKAK